MMFLGKPELCACKSFRVRGDLFWRSFYQPSLWLGQETGHNTMWLGRETGHNTMWLGQETGHNTMWLGRETGHNTMWHGQETGHNTWRLVLACLATVLYYQYTQ